MKRKYISREEKEKYSFFVDMTFAEKKYIFSCYKRQNDKLVGELQVHQEIFTGIPLSIEGSKKIQSYLWDEFAAFYAEKNLGTSNTEFSIKEYCFNKNGEPEYFDVRVGTFQDKFYKVQLTGTLYIPENSRKVFDKTINAFEPNTVAFIESLNKSEVKDPRFISLAIYQAKKYFLNNNRIHIFYHHSEDNDMHRYIPRALFQNGFKKVSEDWNDSLYLYNKTPTLE